VTIDAYALLETRHILSATVLFGLGLGTAVHIWLARRTGDVRVIAEATQRTVMVDWLATLPSGIVRPVSGGLLVWLGRWDSSSPWLLATNALFMTAGLARLAVVVLQLRTRRPAAEALGAGEPLPEAYRRAMRLWLALGRPAFLALILVFGLMVVKPG